MLMCNYDASYADNAGCCEGGNHIENSIGFFFFAYGNSDTDCVSVPSSSLAVEPGEWNHVAITFAAPFSRSNPRKTDPELCFYVNGEQAGCSSDPGYIVSKGAESSDFTIGGYDDSSCGSGSCAGPGSRYKGYMDNLRIWKVRSMPSLLPFTCNVTPSLNTHTLMCWWLTLTFGQTLLTIQSWTTRLVSSMQP